jgi:hypothetical protein
MCPERIATPGWWFASMISTGRLSAENLLKLRKE